MEDTGKRINEFVDQLQRKKNGQKISLQKSLDIRIINNCISDNYLGAGNCCSMVIGKKDFRKIH